MRFLLGREKTDDDEIARLCNILRARWGKKERTWREKRAQELTSQQTCEHVSAQIKGAKFFIDESIPDASWGMVIGLCTQLGMQHRAEARFCTVFLVRIALICHPAWNGKHSSGVAELGL